MLTAVRLHEIKNSAVFDELRNVITTSFRTDSVSH